MLCLKGKKQQQKKTKQRVTGKKIKRRDGKLSVMKMSSERPQV